MAPMAIHEPSLKRTASQAQFDIPAAKKQFLGVTKHHKAIWDSQSDYRRNAEFQNRKLAEDLLTRSITLALEAVGFQAAEHRALDSFRMQVQEYMAHYLADVKQCMDASRRPRAIPPDFLQALHTHQLSLRSLLPHLQPPIPAPQSQNALERLTPDSEQEQIYRPINSLFAEPTHSQSYIPSHFPHLPDKHTYQATPDYTQWEQDPRNLREKVIEEGRLGEQALRRLVAAGTAAASRQKQEGTRQPTLREKRHQLWIDTMAAVAAEQKNSQVQGNDSMDIDAGKDGESARGGALSPSLEHLSSAVNSEKKYWRKPGRA